MNIIITFNKEQFGRFVNTKIEIGSLPQNSRKCDLVENFHNIKAPLRCFAKTNLETLNLSRRKSKKIFFTMQVETILNFL